MQLLKNKEADLISFLSNVLDQDRLGLMGFFPWKSWEALPTQLKAETLLGGGGLLEGK